MSHGPKGVVALPGTGDATHSAIYRDKGSANGYPDLGVSTLYELFSTSVEKYADLPALGFRPVTVSGPPPLRPSAAPQRWICL